MRAILLGPVEASEHVQKKIFRSLKIQPSDILVGVDGGTQVWKKYGFNPHFAVGDWDSLRKKSILAKIRHVTLSRDKERSDLFYAAVAAIEVGADRLCCVGVTGGRPDHHFSNLCDLGTFASGAYGKLIQVEAIGEDGTYTFLSTKIPEWKGKLPLRSIVSIFGHNGGAKGVTLSGFRYFLNDADLKPSSLGVSNLVIQKDCGVRLKTGQLLVIIPRLTRGPVIRRR